MEASSLRRGLVESSRSAVTRTGVGRTRSARSATSARLAAAPAVAVVGIAGGLDGRLRPGDVVVADVVRHAGGALPEMRCPSAPLLASRLRASGLPVWIGSVVTSDHVVAGREREQLASCGALAVDMESAWLLNGNRPEVVVRVVADTAGQSLVNPATLGKVRHAVSELARLGPGLADWSAALGARTVLLAGPRSFCAGVERAIEVVERALHQRGAPIYVRKQIVHNLHVVRELEQRGAVFVDELDDVPDAATVVFSAHGVAPAVREAAEDRRLDVIDATCPLVTKVHTELRRFSDRGDTVIFIGHAGHEETVGTMGERPGRTVLVEDLHDARTVQVADEQHVSYLVQTTLSTDEVTDIVAVLGERFPALRAPASDDICYATTNRQVALRAVAAESEVVLVLGSTNSSNSNRLVETAARMGTPAYLIDDVSDIALSWLTAAPRVGLTAGASAPSALVDEVVEALAGLGPVDVQERHVVTEQVHFTLPKEVRPA
ncbi:MAG: 4-hydroxy-3-methylbut-2-enyl diphosphate reductase [Nocardioidaceae bacterium]